MASAALHAVGPPEAEAEAAEAAADAEVAAAEAAAAEVAAAAEAAAASLSVPVCEVPEESDVLGRPYFDPWVRLQFVNVVLLSAVPSLQLVIVVILSAVAVAISLA